MEYKRVLAAIAAAAVMACSTGCGKDNNTSSQAESSQPSVSRTEDTEETTESSDDEEEEKEKEDNGSKTDKEKTTKAPKDNKDKDTKTEAASDDAAAGTGTSAASAAKTSGNSGSSSGSKSGSGSGSKSDSSALQKATEAPTAAPTEAPTEPPTEAPTEPPTEAPTEPESPYAAEITFNGAPAVVKGSNVTIEGNRAIITAGGSYYITGSSGDGQICVSTATEEKVKIILAGVSITCNSGPAVFINEAKRCTVEMLEGTANYLSDSAKDNVNDGVIFSNDTLRLKGTGSLEIAAGNKHGIASDDDVIIEGGNYTISSVKSGIYAHDNITINDGNLTVRGGTNGLKSRGSINIKGGTSYISGGTKEEKSSIYAAGVFSYTGGTVFAAGNKVTAPTNTAYPFAVASLTNPGAAGGGLGLFINGVQQGDFAPHNDYRCIMMLSPNLYIGAEVGFAFNDNYYAGYTIADTSNVFTIE